MGITTDGESGGAWQHFVRGKWNDMICNEELNGYICETEAKRTHTGKLISLSNKQTNKQKRNTRAHTPLTQHNHVEPISMIYWVESDHNYQKTLQNQ